MVFVSNFKVFNEGIDFSEIEDYFLSLKEDDGWNVQLANPYVFYTDSNGDTQTSGERKETLHLSNTVLKSNFNIEIKKVINAFKKVRDVKEFNRVVITIITVYQRGESTLVWNGSDYKLTDDWSLRMVLKLLRNNKPIGVYINADL